MLLTNHRFIFTFSALLIQKLIFVASLLSRALAQSNVPHFAAFTGQMNAKSIPDYYWFGTDEGVTSTPETSSPTGLAAAE